MSLEQFRQQKDEFFKFHPQSPIPPEKRADFAGLVYFPPNPALDLTLKAEVFTEQQPIQMQTSTGDLRPYVRWGQIQFAVNGEPVQLTIYFSPQIDHYFLPFMDATSGEETYSAGRYLDPEVEADGTVHVDFNVAYAPYCAYNPHYSCPIPPKENRLTVRVEAGEKLYPDAY